jgi:hypothetical protein
MRASTKTTLAVAILVSFSAGVLAQERRAFPLPLGSRVRITATRLPGGRLTGTLVASDGAALTVADARGARLTVSRAEVTRLELSSGRHGRWLQGLVAGAAVTAVVWASLDDRGNCGFTVYQECTRGAAAVLGAVVGAAPGALIGSLIKRERWSAVPVSYPAVSVHPVRGGFGVSVRASF